ncbi:MAG TPA: hypothetical protein VNV43_14990, partial [Candidatus Acidoferrales bacterium]|nr:hypothetical protein [Candidatus Acidoferrales bacterium]
KMLSVSEVLEKERSECQQAIAAINWESDSLVEAISDLTCAECSSPLLLPVAKERGANLRCRSCGEEEKFDHYAPRALTDHFAADNHYSYKDGGDPLTITCPFCCEEAYVVSENKCILCGESCETECSRCGNEIPVCELNDGSLCGYCDHMMSKDD